STAHYFFFHGSAYHRDLHSFPTRRSSDLHRISVEVQKLKLRGGRDEMRSAYGNLVSNAVRYTPVGGHIALRCVEQDGGVALQVRDRKSTRLNSSHVAISYAVFCLKKKKYT